MNLTIGEDLIPFDDTFILYNPHDIISVLSVYLSLSPILILMFYLSWLIITREIESVIVACGQLSNEVLNKILKKLIKENRPYGITSLHYNSTINFNMGPGYGMPSAHSQFVGFFTVYFLLRIKYKWKFVPVDHILYSTLIATLGALVCFSRIYLCYHNLKQVVVGYSIGLLNGSLYYIFVDLVRSVGTIDYLLNTWIFQRFYIKDTCNLCPATLQEEHSSYRSRTVKPKSQ
ncbi:hypothetical protein KAFR_0F03860 [Kazachstania africana CBS 2517]|uniref:Phosphatidic acid phosphatase type 2/haloperoxidase domain-containing protein n=1 Tax=Kazachstania africana (strain ATCC 22294 / BCRC 22015 / CBS 2517 / CECT 1963 / NBRC 1671 / NRRL Y-8276) TaxID=1071382 RepID=H2AX82_KAZAF|nr:hypothetical protein KAFR_0F03860 [Kazachstania africana CBS 2517]CCF58982.1 hypothetical protein KAFR_0F03860 [Kazachstania africana CBS 2517]